jgi:hypothetical protein
MICSVEKCRFLLPGSNSNACCLGVSSSATTAVMGLFDSRRIMPKRERYVHFVTSVPRHCFDVIKLSISKLIRWIKRNTSQKLQGLLSIRCKLNSSHYLTKGNWFSYTCKPLPHNDPIPNKIILMSKTLLRLTALLCLHPLHCMHKTAPVKRVLIA